MEPKNETNLTFTEHASEMAAIGREDLGALINLAQRGRFAEGVMALKFGVVLAPAGGVTVKELNRKDQD